MQFSTFIVALMAPIVLAAPIAKRSAGQATIKNSCDFDVNVVPWVNGVPGESSTIPAGESWSETQRASGESTSLKVSTDGGDDVAQMEYTTNSDMNLVFYDLSLINGNPFSAWPQLLSAGNDGSEVACAAGELPCAAAYFVPDQVATKAAPLGTDLTYEICKTN